MFTSQQHLQGILIKDAIIQRVKYKTREQSEAIRLN